MAQGVCKCTLIKCRAPIYVKHANNGGFRAKYAGIISGIIGNSKHKE